MAYGVVCTFDLKNESGTDYQNAYSDLEALGLKRAQGNSSGDESVIPTTTVLGSYNGESAASIRDHVRTKVQAAFKARGLSSEIFIVVGGQDPTWGSTTS
ncbi:hypothetical protein [Burkholderia multivorans]|uniref:hypothetical protein n=1 Tax=Burkholderia multivorans TaxID=87883 RepID=UPI0009C087EA|nr:hypothetical protein [Burkholderia multivorans]PRH48508.1 hypothetical protein C6V05_08765 [Burkholderia multivorans]